MVLLCMSFVGILFIIHKSFDGEKVKDQSVYSSPFTHNPDAPQNLEWFSSCQENSSVASIDGFSRLPKHIQDFLRYKHCRSFPQLLNEPQKCGGRAASKRVFLLLAIKSSPENYNRRSVIRQTWGDQSNYANAYVKRIFLLGMSKNQKENLHLRQLLRIESKLYSDILQWDLHDTFFNLTLKQVLFYHWLKEYCPEAHFIFNGDDDVFVNTFNVITYLRELRADSHLFVGLLIANVGPIRNPNSKYYVPLQVTRSSSYPKYCGGGGILMSRLTAHAIYNKSLEIPLFPIDDVYLGMCLEKAGLVPSSHMAMKTAGIDRLGKLDSFDPCHYKELLLVHRFVPYQMLVMWKAVQDPQLHCGRKVSVYIDKQRG
uniref:Hexosyltransferase n=1 Tax=Pyxicephalus adspersus TaxID=30357 RepID=A0AAV3ABU6_PYXAD|nr:TPA: hypothetical protein GDO54_017307 [Pyxicephalus adspersus]